MSLQKSFTTLLIVSALFSQTVSFYSQQLPGPVDLVDAVTSRERADAYKDVTRIGSEDLMGILEKLFGADAAAAAETLSDGSFELFEAVTGRAAERTNEILENQVTQRRESKNSSVVIAPTEDGGRRKQTTKRRSGIQGFRPVPTVDWKNLAFGFLPLVPDESPEIKMTETEKQITAQGSQKKSFETKDAKGTRTQKVETTYLKDGKTFGVEIKDTQVIEAVSKPDGKSFRQELSLVWGAEVAACPDANGVTAGTGRAKVISKTTYVENGVSITMTSDFDLQAKLSGQVDDRAKLTHYDLQVDAYLTNSGYENALQRKLVKEIKIKDGRYGIHFDIPGNTIEVSDGKYGGERTPAKMGKPEGRLLIPAADADATIVGKAIGPMIPTIWNSANEMYKSAERHWRTYGCVEVVSKVAKTVLEPGEEISISSETVHLQDKSKVNSEMTAEGYEGVVSPETQSAKTTARFMFAQSGDSASTFSVESVSKRGIGKGDVEFQLKKEKEETAPGTWTGTIKAERKGREEREKRSGANLAENGGHVETTTSVQLELTGRIDRTVDATNAHIAMVSGVQETVDHEYDRYTIDEGYCGPNATPYKGPKEITRTSTTTVNYAKETRVYVEVGSSGSITFSLPEAEGTTVHKYVHKSPCADHDRANTNEAVDEKAPTAGGSFSFSFPVDPTQKSVKGTITVRGDDGSTTTYTWNLARVT